MSEFSQKQDRIQSLLKERNLDALLLRRVSSFAWATCGAASYVNTATTNGEAALVITPSGRHVVTNNIEATRLEREEKLAAQGWDLRVVPWHDAQDAVAELTRGLKVGADEPYADATDLSEDLAGLRAHLLPEEGERFRALGRLCAQAMENAARMVRPGQSEYQIAGLLAREAESRGVQAIVNLIATDKRIFDFRHPLPTDKKLERYAMLVLCGRKWGLVASLTRLVHFGTLPDELREKQEAVAEVDAAFIAASRPGARIADIFGKGVKAYAKVGYPDEWQLHHQGGLAGYEPREHLATAASSGVVKPGQAFAWNPSITGTKSEDTILIGEEGCEVITAMEDWPRIAVQVEGQLIERPVILEVF
ncbi:MAG: M24 family metallopeptidase [Anaerolineae bacterium]|nr:M24 family metallopeptidase [Anaerolineae bacterium]